MGLTDVTTIKYNRPAVKGREGKIWGTLIPEGFLNPISATMQEPRGEQAPRKTLQSIF